MPGSEDKPDAPTEPTTTADCVTISIPLGVVAPTLVYEPLNGTTTFGLYDTYPTSNNTQPSVRYTKLSNTTATAAGMAVFAGNLVNRECGSQNKRRMLAYALLDDDDLQEGSSRSLTDVVTAIGN